MAWSSLGTQFCLELAFGVFLGLCLIPRAPLGVFFYRLMGTAGLVPLLVAALAPPLFGDVAWSDGGVVAALAGMLAFPVIQGPVKSSKRLVALIWITGLTAVALVFTVARAAPQITSAGDLALGGLSAMATGAVAGGVGLAMVVGHWYLTVPQLPVSWLRRLNKLTAWAMVGSAVLLVITCFVYVESLQSARTPLLGPWGLFYLGARVGVGLVLPLLFAWMTASSLAYENTRSATGILYASTVLVLIGTAVSISLQDTYGMPL